MGKCCFLFLTLYLAFGAGLSLFAQANNGRSTMEERQSTREWQNGALFRSIKGSQDSVGIQNKEIVEDTLQLQHSRNLRNGEEWQHSRESQNTGEPQNEEDPLDKTKIRLTANRLVIEGLPEDGLIEIYNIMGVKVYNRRVKAGFNQYLLSLPKGYYIIRIGKVTRKIAIK